MKSLLLFVNFVTSFYFISCRDFYMGMFNRDDYLVAQDNLYKEKRPYTRVQAEYGRLFKCPITYFRVVDRLGMGPGPTVKILKGGLRKNYIAVRLRSGFNLPISVNIYVGCQNRKPRSPIRPTRATKPTKLTTEAKIATGATSEPGAAAETGTADSGGASATTAGSENNTGNNVTAQDNSNSNPTTVLSGPVALKRIKSGKDQQPNIHL